MQPNIEKSPVIPKMRPYSPFLGILLASAIAHLWCLGSQFYMDDWPTLETLTRPISHLWSSPLTVWTFLCYTIQHQLFGPSPVAFHAVNWLLHSAIACVLFGFGRDFLRDRWPAGIAFFGALLFAVHPLASEIPNYARTQDLAWVTLFSLLAAWSALRFLREGGQPKWIACAACITGAMLSKGPGLFHALMMVAAIGISGMTDQHWQTLRKKTKLIAGIGVLFVIILWITGIFDRLPQVSDPRFIGHAYTLSRVFWEFAWRSIVPVALSSDHEITETLMPPHGGLFPISDPIAILSATALLGLTAFSLWLAWKKSTHHFGICLFLYIATILFRVLYLIPEFMPEYRIYPGLPWFCLGAAIALAGTWRLLFETLSPRLPAAILLILFAGLSAKRSFVWHDLDRLAGDVLKRYPARARAIWELHDRDVREKNWTALIKRQQTAWPDAERHFVTGNQKLAPGREIPSGDFVLAMIGIFGNYAIALSHEQSPAAGLRIIDQLESHMKLMKMTPKEKPNEWNYFFRAKASVLENAGRDQEAINTLRLPEFMPASWQKDLDRLEKKRAAMVKPGS